MNESETNHFSCSFLTINLDKTREVLITNVVACVLNTLLSLMTCFGNSIVVYAIHKSSYLHSPSVVLLCCLAVSDLLVGAICQPFFVAYKVAELVNNFSAFCPLKIIQYMSGWITGGVSFLTLALIAIDRLLMLKFHLRYNSIVTLPRVVEAVLAVWFVCIAGATSKFYFQSIWIALPSTVLLVTCLVTALCAWKIFHIARKHQRQINSQNIHALRKPDTVNILKCKKSAVTVLFLYGLFLIFYLPLFATMVVNAFVGYTREVKIAYNFVSTAIYINSFLNPLVYCWRMREIRQAVKAILSKKTPVFCKKRSEWSSNDGNSLNKRRPKGYAGVRILRSPLRSTMLVN